MLHIAIGLKELFPGYADEVYIRMAKDLLDYVYIESWSYRHDVMEVEEIEQ